MALREIQTTLDRIKVLEHVEGYLCVPIRTTFDDEYTKNLVTHLQPFLERIKRTIHHLGLKELLELRLKTKYYEYLLRTDHQCSFIVVQRQGKVQKENDE
ncbi:hypothetical protein I4U23_017640 [Adineta vaga]|nr:hypothetical protein I4U23_017640 [Adineta vaga]